MRGLSYWLYQPYKYFILYPLFAAVTITCAVFAVFFAAVASPRVGSYMGVLWAKTMQVLTPMWVSVKGRENIKRGQSYVIVANHQSAYDIFVLYGNIGVDFKWIMKKELRQAPFLGWSCASLKHIFIDRSSARAAYRSIQRAKDILVGGTSVIIFPEGTRSMSGNIGKFKHGAFKMAFEMGLPILPVTIKDSYKILGKGMDTLMPGRVELIIHEPIDTNLYRDNRESLTEVTFNSVASGL